MYHYIIYMKNGKEFKIQDNTPINDLITKLLPKNKYEINVYHFKLLDTENKNVAIIGNEISSIEYDAN